MSGSQLKSDECYTFSISCLQKSLHLVWKMLLISFFSTKLPSQHCDPRHTAAESQSQLEHKQQNSQYKTHVVLDTGTSCSVESSDSLEVLALTAFADLLNSSYGHMVLLQIMWCGFDTEVECGNYLQSHSSLGSNASHFMYSTLQLTSELFIFSFHLLAKIGKKKNNKKKAI